MADKKYVGTFHSEYEVLDRIDALKAQGISENDIYVITNDTDSLSMVQGRTDVDMRTSEGNWLDKFKAFLTGDEPVMAAFTNMGFTEEESTLYYQEAKKGGILLFVDRNYNHVAHDYVAQNQEAGYVNEHVDANLGSNLTVEDPVNPLEDEEHIPANVDPEEHFPVEKEQRNTERLVVDDEVAPIDSLNERDNVHIPTIEEEMARTQSNRRHEDDIYRSEQIGREIGDIETEIDKERLRNDAVTDRNRLI